MRLLVLVNGHPVRALELPGPVIHVDGRDVDPAAVAAAVRAAVG